MKGLATLIRLRRQALDERRKALGALEREGEALARAVVALDDEMAAESDAARRDAETAYGYGSYLAAVRRRRADLEARIEALSHRMGAAREAVAEAFRDLKRFEQAEAIAADKARIEASRREQAALDEVALGIYRRRETG